MFSPTNHCSRSAVIALCGVLLLTGRPPAAARAQNAVNTPEEELFLIAQKAFDDGFYDVAERYIDQFLHQYPESEQFIQARLLLGQCYFFEQQYLKAFQVFEDLLQYNEFKDITLYWLGETYFKGADFRQAQKYYQQLITAYPTSSYQPHAHYGLGWTYFEAGDYPQAKEWFSKLIQQYPDHQLSEDATFKLGESEQQLGHHAEAITFFSAYIERYPQSNRLAEALFYIAEAYYFEEDYLTAVTYYAKAADKAYDGELRFMAKVSMGWSYLKLEKYELSEAAFLKARKIAEEKHIPGDEVDLGLASLYSEQQRLDDAAKAYRHLITEYPKSLRLAEAHLGLANIAYTQKEYREAIRDYKWIIENTGGQGQAKNTQKDIREKAYYGLAWTYLKNGQPDQSIQLFEDIMKETDSKVVKVSALTQIGDAYQDMDQLDKAITVYDRVLKEYPDSLYIDYVQFRQGVALLKQNELEAATLSFQTLQSNFPRSDYIKEAQYYLAVAYFKQEDWRQTIAYARKYLDGAPSVKPFTSEALYIKALSHFNIKAYTEAAADFQNLSTAFPELDNMVQLAELNTAKCWYHLKRIDEALQRFAEISEKYPETPSAQEALLWLGDHYLEAQDFRPAIQHYQTFLNRFPGSEKHDLVMFQIGQAYQALREYDEALTSYKAIPKKADTIIYAKARLAIAEIFSSGFDDENALKTYEDIVATVPEFRRDALKKIGDIHKKYKRFSTAIESYEKALEAKSELSQLHDVEIQFELADTFEVLNDAPQAVGHYLKIPYLYPEDKYWQVKAYLRVARIFEDNEEWQKAQTTYQKILTFKTEESKYAQERLEWLSANAL